MSLSFVLDPPLTDALRADIVALWTDVTNAGGAVGFVAPVTRDQVRPVAEAALAGVAAGPDRLLVGVDDGGWWPCCSWPTTGSRSRRTGGSSSGSWWIRPARAVATAAP
ncbi:hypothetical protein GCM10020358_14070 [Amorphoplanes nipponensis]